ncbi:condensin [Culex quinquefasciatus]|uniref:Condensin n=1 Tax=Culex quinquefasciatus TaxID=7176 RepID=B0XCQ7_CULQU|nr:condensin [Culex quinquefasciatus]|eukprot:XP_001867429.1 condensin [Culex quinquefasciatus]
MAKPPFERLSKHKVREQPNIQHSSWRRKKTLCAPYPCSGGTFAFRSDRGSARNLRRTGIGLSAGQRWQKGVPQAEWVPALKDNEQAEVLYNLFQRPFCIASIYLVLNKELIERVNVDTTYSQTAKHMSQLLELGMLAPKLIIPNLSTMSDELRNLESYVMRNCVLHIMGEAIEELADELKETRDDFLHDLFNHTMDVSAHVRSKVLQIRHYIQGQNAVPLSSWQHQVLKGSVERLEDKSLLVRKNSIALILEHNPFSAKLSRIEKNRLKIIC